MPAGSSDKLAARFVRYWTSPLSRVVLLLVLAVMPVEAALSAAHGVFCLAKSHQGHSAQAEDDADRQWSDQPPGIVLQAKDRACCCQLPVAAVASEVHCGSVLSPTLTGRISVATFKHFPDPPRRPPRTPS